MTKRQLDGSLAEVGINDQYYQVDRLQHSKLSRRLMLAAEAICHYFITVSSQVVDTGRWLVSQS